jgi:predicted ATPase
MSRKGGETWGIRECRAVAVSILVEINHKGEKMEAMNFDRLFVITGGPGSGKSALVDALSQRGICTMPEAGRAIIQDQVAIGGEALPWSDRRAFAELMLSWEMRSYREALKLNGPVIFDRGIPDVLGYLRLSNLSIPAHIERAAQMFRYHHRVLIAPPWAEIFKRDAERKQSFEEARATYEAMIETYSELGYNLTQLPLDSVQERVRFVLAAIS